MVSRSAHITCTVSQTQGNAPADFVCAPQQGMVYLLRTQTHEEALRDRSHRCYAVIESPQHSVKCRRHKLTLHSSSPSYPSASSPGSKSPATYADSNKTSSTGRTYSNRWTTRTRRVYRCTMDQRKGGMVVEDNRGIQGRHQGRQGSRDRTTCSISRNRRFGEVALSIGIYPEMEEARDCIIPSFLVCAINDAGVCVVEATAGERNTVQLHALDSRIVLRPGRFERVADRTVSIDGCWLRQWDREGRPLQHRLTKLCHDTVLIEQS